jgi:hypothetical protein
MQRWFGALLITLGCAIMVIEMPTIDGVVLTVAHGHGVHLSDFLGGLVVVAGIAALWTAPPQ